MTKGILVGLFSFFQILVLAQEEKDVFFSWSGYLEAYYHYDFNRPPDNEGPSFLYSHNRHNEFNVNLGYLKGSFLSARVRANLALAAGTYVNANYAAEPGVLKNVYEANAGFKLSREKNLWLDAGIFGSHIGCENACSKDCWALTRSMAAENSPYYEAGAKITYLTDNGRWLISLLALNGWQRITRVEGNSLMSWGTQVQYKPSEKVLLNYSTFIGTDKPDSARFMRVFNNFYGVLGITDKLGLTIGFDLGFEEESTSNGRWNAWYSPVGIIRYSLTSKWALAGRMEFYNDKNAVIISTGTRNEFQTTGYSVNIDFIPVKYAAIRFEGRLLKSRDAIFTREGEEVSSNAFVTGSIAVSF